MAGFFFLYSVHLVFQLHSRSLPILKEEPGNLGLIWIFHGGGRQRNSEIGFECFSKWKNLIKTCVLFVCFLFLSMNGRTDASTRDKPAWRKSATANVNTNPENALDGRSRFRRMRSRLNAEETDRPLTISPLAQSNSVRLLFVCIDRSHSKRGHLFNKLLENCRDPCLFFHNILNVKPGTRWPLYTIVNQKFFWKFSTFG